MQRFTLVAVVVGIALAIIGGLLQYAIIKQLEQR